MLNISNFSGNIAEWLSFWSRFETSVHKNDSLDLVDKFNLLKTFLAPNLLKSTEGFAVTADNYLKAIEILKDRYGRKDLLINVHMNRLLSLSHIKYSSYTKNLYKIYDKIQTQIRSLEFSNILLDTHSILLYPILLKILPHDIA